VSGGLTPSPSGTLGKPFLTRAQRGLRFPSKKSNPPLSPDRRVHFARLAIQLGLVARKCRRVRIPKKLPGRPLPTLRLALSCSALFAKMLFSNLCRISHFRSLFENCGVSPSPAEWGSHSWRSPGFSRVPGLGSPSTNPPPRTGTSFFLHFILPYRCAATCKVPESRLLLVGWRHPGNISAPYGV
jgi:hypothetical protein